MKFKQLLISIGIGVIGFAFYSILQNVSDVAFWVILVFVALAAAGYYTMPMMKNEMGLSAMQYVFTYGCMFSFIALVHWLSFKVLPGIKFDTFFKGLLLFIGSLFIVSILATFVKKGVKAIIAFKSWKADPAWNFQTIAFGFLCLIAIMWWIGGIVECGIAGSLSLLGIALAFIPNSILEAITSVPASSASSESDVPSYSDEPEKIELEDGTILTKESGHWMDEKRHEWKEDTTGWSDQGFR